MAETRGRVGWFAAAAIVALLASLVPVGSAAASPDAEARLLARHNEARAAESLPPLHVHGELTAVARKWAARLRDDYETSDDRSGSLRHNPSLASQLPSGYQRAAENVGFTALTDASNTALADRLHDAYLASPNHRANILGDYDRVGVGMAVASDGTLWSTVVFMQGADEPSPKGAATTTSGAPEPASEGTAAEPTPDPVADATREPDPQPDPQPDPEPLTAASLFGQGWPAGFLAPGELDLGLVLAGTRDGRAARLFDRLGPPTPSFLGAPIAR